jgi:hypothetical protein
MSAISILSVEFLTSQGHEANSSYPQKKHPLMSLKKADLIDPSLNRFDFSEAKSTQVVESLLEIGNVPIGEIRFIQ